MGNTNSNKTTYYLTLFPESAQEFMCQYKIKNRDGNVVTMKLTVDEVLELNEDPRIIQISTHLVTPRRPASYIE